MGITWEEYQDQVKADALDVIESEYSDYEDWDEMSEALFIDDSVTGNCSGSYTFCAATAAENVAGIIFDPEAVDAFNEYGYEGIPTEKGPEACDVIARCIALGYVSYELEERFDELKAENDQTQTRKGAIIKTLPNISDAVITDWDGGAIEYHVEGDSTYTADNAFIFTPTTPHMGLLTLNDRNGREMLTVCQEHDFEDFNAYIAHRVACHVEMYW